MGPSIETLLLELYEYRVASTHTTAGDVTAPFEDVPVQLMKALDKEYLLLKAAENDLDNMYDGVCLNDDGLCLD